MPEAAEAGRELHPEGGGDRHGSARRQRLGQHKHANVGVAGVVEVRHGTGYAEGQAVEVAPLASGGEVKARPAPEQLLTGEGGMVAPIGAGPQVEHDGVQRPGGMVGVGQFQLAV